MKVRAVCMMGVYLSVGEGRLYDGSMFVCR